MTRLLIVGMALMSALGCEPARRPTEPDSALAGSAGAAGAAGANAGAGGEGEAGAAGSQVPPVDASVPITLPAPQLVSPADGASDIALRTPLCWTPPSSPGLPELRYRVFVNDLELLSGKVGENGFRGPCTEPLAFEAGREYAWYAIAFDPAGSALPSAKSATFTFTTAIDRDNPVVFQDDFDSAASAPWTATGDAAQGAWVRGTPEQTMYEGALSQPGACNDGASCFFTARNPEQRPASADVSGGSVVLESRRFDLSAAAGVTVSLARFFYRADALSSGARLQIELLVSDSAAPDGYRARVLEALEGDAAQAANVWTAMSYAVCDPPFGADARLRITATDDGTSVVEAAIDSVTVTAHVGGASCERGAGALCDPKAADACEGELLCCAQGTLNRGVHRCVAPARAIDEQDPQAAGEPNTGALGCPLPDLRVVADPGSVRIQRVNFEADACALREGCVGGPGFRRLLRFGMYTRNVGAGDLVLGVPANRPDQYRYDACHEHYHFAGFADYQLLDADGEVVAEGAKIAQCVWDSGSWAWSEARAGAYSCYNQGISVGWEDEYAADLDCQWIDITDVPPGDYTVRVDINRAGEQFAAPRLVERDYDNNSDSFMVEIPP